MSSTAARPGRPQPQRARALLHAAVAVAGLSLLAFGVARTPLGTLAAWNQERTVSLPAVTAGELGFTKTSGSVVLRRIDFAAGATTITNLTALTSTDITASPGSHPLIPGDEVQFNATITIDAVGTNLTARLVVDAASPTGSNPALTTELAVTGNSAVTITPVGAAPALAPDGPGAWLVTPASNGHSYTVTNTVKVRATTNGAARSATQPGNWWMTTLQGTSTSADTFAVTLTQIP